MPELINELDFLPRFIVNTIFLIVLVTACYFQRSKNRPYAASFILFGTGVFLVTTLLHTADISMGFAFGLFAVFSMLRYRTESITIKEMTYLFLVISIALLTAVAPISLLAIIIANAIICVFAYILETGHLLQLTEQQVIKYDNIANIKPEDRDTLIDELKQKTGLKIIHLRIASVDFVNKTAQIRICYKVGDDR